ncbi:hypothetical protein ACSBM8_17200 [Sphingomonas sp. ASY06-1R]|uniref:hypothetical protein n=1 Tax=Sphingomonas sp. ASY06-1R TaxID=3445771 RepID=UPI003FA2CA84
MSRALARALMHLAICCLGRSRQEWARAMQAEFEAVEETGNPLIFAGGCLIAAWREVPHHAEGRFGLVTHLLAIGLLIPIACLQFAYAIGLTMGPHGAYFMLVATGSDAPYAADAQRSGIPALLLLWSLLGVAHLQLAWVLLDRDWDRIVRIGAMIAAGMLTLVLFMELLMLHVGTLLMQAGVLTIELIVILAIARWHSRIGQDGVTALPA